MRIAEHTQGDLLGLLLGVLPKMKTRADCEPAETPGTRRLVLLTVAGTGSAA